MIDVPTDTGEFGRFYQAFRPLVFAVAMRFVRDPYDADDMTQSVFLKVWKNPAAFRGGNIESWLTSITKNACVDDLRRAARSVLLSNGGEELPNGPQRSVEDEVVARSVCAAIVSALLSLSDEKRSALVSAFFRNQTHECISESTHIPLGTIKTRIRSGLGDLRKRLADA